MSASKATQRLLAAAASSQEAGARLGLDLCGSGFGHEGIAVEQEEAVAVGFDRESPIQRGGSRSVTSAGPSRKPAGAPPRSRRWPSLPTAKAALDDDGVFA